MNNKDEQDRRRHHGTPSPSDREELLERSEQLEATLRTLLDEAQVAWRALYLIRRNALSDEHIDGYEQGLRFAIRDTREALGELPYRRGSWRTPGS